ncbi:MAG: type II toxin-antitoxin system RelE/ParE family toxin [Clostridia bacterium]|nr:type II toxin-antitoxin system RelE/ParE family toxin [Clostridia bacterium]
MSYKLRISEQAQNDIESIYNYVLKDGESIAKKQANVIYSSLENLQLFSEMGANLSNYTLEKNDYKFLSIKKTYIAFYKIVGDEVRVIRIFRGEQDYLRQLGIK